MQSMLAIFAGFAMFVVLHVVGGLLWRRIVRPLRDPRAAGEHAAAIEGPALRSTHRKATDRAGTAGKWTSHGPARGPTPSDRDGHRAPRARGFTIGGQAYMPLEQSTLEHDHWYMTLVRDAGLAGIERVEQESAEAFARRVLDVAMASRRASLLIAGLLVPAGTPDSAWSPELARELAERFDRVTDDAEKELLNTTLVGLVADFFAVGLISAAASGTSSGDQPRRRPTPGLPGAGANGPTSSARSRITTTTAAPPSRAGRWKSAFARFWNSLVATRSPRTGTSS